MSISRFQRIKGPDDQPNPPPQRFVTLKKFQRPPNSPVAIIPMHTRHVRMKKHRPVRKSHERQGVANQAFPVEGPQNLAARFRRHHKQRRRLYFKVFLAPNFPLQRNASLKLLDARALSDDDPRAHRPLRASAGLPAVPFSARFAVSQNSSMCSRELSASAFPLL